MKIRILALVTTLAAVSWSPIFADWLVTVDGARIETKGSWKVKGNQVIFTLPTGTLSTIRKSEVDLDASAVATKESNSPEVAAPVAEPVLRPKATIVLNNKNIRSAVEPGRKEGEGDSEAPKSSKPQSEGSVELVSWTSRDSVNGDGLEVIGTVRNQGVELAANISVKIIVVDETNQPVFDTTAFMRSTGLVPGKSTTFRALLPGIYTLFREPQFEVRSGNFTVKPDPKDELDSEEPEPGEIR